MLRKALAAGAVALTTAAAATAATSPAGTYKGSVSGGGGHITLTLAGSSVKTIRISGTWHCVNATVGTPSPYRFTATNKPGQIAAVKRGGAFTFTTRQIKFKSPDASNNTGAYYVSSFVVSGKFSGTNVTGTIEDYGETNIDTCSDKLTFKATRR